MNRMSPWYEKLSYNIYHFFESLFLGIINFFKSIPRYIMTAFNIIKNSLIFFIAIFKEGDIFTKLSYIIMGSSNIFRGQIAKGLIYLIIEIAYVMYMILTGFSSFTGLVTLGSKTQGWVFDEVQGIDVMQEGDNSMLILLFGVFAIILTFTFIVAYILNLRSAIEVQRLKKAGEKLPSFKEDIKSYLDNNFHKTLLTLPCLGVILLTILPLIFMILIAFTNFDNKHQPPGNLFTWVGLSNFKTMLFSGDIISNTFWPVLGWTVTWAIFATFLNYIFGILLALLINKKGIKFKAFWRTMFVLSIAVPMFVSLLVMKTMLNDQGAINVLLKELGLIDTYIPFLSKGNIARVTIIIVNLWIGIPYTMLTTSGILMNIPADLYESAQIDGASPVTMFFKITMPYILFVTTPTLITSFIGNINNFNVIYLLSAGGPLSLDYYQAGQTDLLVTWLYKLTTTSKDYSYASTIGIFVFILSATISLIVYRNTNSYKNEEEFQ